MYRQIVYHVCYLAEAFALDLSDTPHQPCKFFLAVVVLPDRLPARVFCFVKYNEYIQLINNSKINSQVPAIQFKT